MSLPVLVGSLMLPSWPVRHPRPVVIIIDGVIDVSQRTAGQVFIVAPASGFGCALWHQREVLTGPPQRTPFRVLMLAALMPAGPAKRGTRLVRVAGDTAAFQAPPVRGTQAIPCAATGHQAALAHWSWRSQYHQPRPGRS